MSWEDKGGREDVEKDTEKYVVTTFRLSYVLYVLDRKVKEKNSKDVWKVCKMTSE